MYIDLSTLESKAIYNLMVQAIVPRPIAWILSLNEDGGYNLAPFSYFNGITSTPPLLSISMGRKPDGGPKDTLRNIDERERFVLHIPSTAQQEAVQNSAAVLPYGESELKTTGLELIDDDDFGLPRLKDAKVALLCRKHQIIELEGVPQRLVIGRIEKFYIDDSLASEGETGVQIDPIAFAPLSKLGGTLYGSTTVST